MESEEKGAESLVFRQNLRRLQRVARERGKSVTSLRFKEKKWRAGKRSGEKPGDFQHKRKFKNGAKYDWPFTGLGRPKKESPEKVLEKTRNLEN